MSPEPIESKYSSEELRDRWGTPEGRKRLADVLRSLRRGDDDWEKCLDGFMGVDEIENGKDLRFVEHGRQSYFDGQTLWRLVGANLQNANLLGAGLLIANLSGANLRGANLSEADLFSTNLSGATLLDANLSGATLWGANLSGATLQSANLSCSNLLEANLTGAHLYEANLSDAKLESAILSDAFLKNADLTGVNFTYALFTYQKRTPENMLNRIKFSVKHDANYDCSDTIGFSPRERYLHWGIIRALGSIPLFGVSWLAIALALVVINTIGLLNETHLIEDWIKYPIPIPQRMTLILIDSILLVLGTTLYKFSCPEIVQQFSETYWLQELGKPRLIYLREKWSRRKFQWPTLFFLAVGGVLALYLLGDRAVTAIIYLWKSFL